MEWDAQFSRFVREYTDNLYRTAYALVGEPAAAADLVQETLTRLYPTWLRMQATDSAPAYVRKALVNRFLSEQRRRRAHEVVQSRVPDHGRDEAGFARFEGADAFGRALAELPPRQRAAIVLRYLYDLDDRRAAAELGCLVPTVRSLIRRALITLRTADGVTSSTAYDLGSGR